jgi:hypothetical protein
MIETTKKESKLEKLLQDNEEIIWKDIPDYKGYYQVNNLGNIRSIKREIITEKGVKQIRKEVLLKSRLGNKGYLYVILCKLGITKTITVHQLVAIVFLDYKPDGTTKIVVDHIDNNPLNNKLENLQVITQYQNRIKDMKGFSSNFPGVCWSKFHNKWRVRVQYNNIRRSIGYFDNEQDAIDACKNELIKLNRYE